MEADNFPIEDEVVHSNLNSILKSVCKNDIGSPEDIPSLFIDSQPQPFIIDDYLEKISSPTSKGEFNWLAKLEKINMLK